MYLQFCLCSPDRWSIPRFPWGTAPDPEDSVRINTQIRHSNLKRRETIRNMEYYSLCTENIFNFRKCTRNWINYFANSKRKEQKHITWVGVVDKAFGGYIVGYGYILDTCHRPSGTTIVPTARTTCSTGGYKARYHPFGYHFIVHVQQGVVVGQFATEVHGYMGSVGVQELLQCEGIVGAQSGAVWIRVIGA